MDIIIDTLTGSSFEVHVTESDTILSLKNKIQKHEGIPASQQHLLWRDEELSDHKSLSDYKLSDGNHLKLVLGMRGGPLNTYCTSQLRIQFLKYSPRLYSSFLFPSKKNIPFRTGSSASSSCSSIAEASADTLKLSSSSDSESNDDFSETYTKGRLSTSTKDKTEYLIELSRITEERINLLICHYENYIKLLSCPIRSVRRSYKTPESKITQDLDSDDEDKMEIQPASKSIASAGSTAQIEAIVELNKPSKTPPLGEPPLFTTLTKPKRVVNCGLVPENWSVLDDRKVTSDPNTSSPVLKSLKLQPPTIQRHPSSFLNKNSSLGTLKNRETSQIDSKSISASFEDGLNREVSRMDSKVSFLDNFMSSVFENDEIESCKVVGASENKLADFSERLNSSWEFEDPDIAAVAGINDSLKEDIANLLEDDATESSDENQLMLYYPVPFRKHSKVIPPIQSRLNSNKYKEKKTSFENRIKEMQKMKEKVHELKQQMLVMKEVREKRVKNLRQSRAKNCDALPTTSEDVKPSQTSTSSLEPKPVLGAIQAKKFEDPLANFSASSSALDLISKPRITWVKEGDTWRKKTNPDRSSLSCPKNDQEKGQAYLDLYTDVMSYLNEKNQINGPKILPAKSSANCRLPPLLQPDTMSRSLTRTTSLEASKQTPKSSLFGSSLPILQQAPPGLLMPCRNMSKKFAATLDLSDVSKSCKAPLATSEVVLDEQAKRVSDTSSKPSVSKPGPSMRCAVCKKRTGLASSYSCLCGNNYCAQHRYAETHDCVHDYKSDARRALCEANPLVNASKLPKI